MMRTILVPLDGSRFSEAALPIARQLAERSGGTIRLALAHHTLPAWNPAIGFPDGGAAIEAQTRAREAAYLTGMAEQLGADLGREVPQALLIGPPGEAIVRHAEESGAGIIVMATHGRGPASRFWLGSTTDYVLRHVDIPVLAVHPQTAEAAAVRRILIPLDESPLSRSVVAPAADVARILGAEMLLLSVVEPLLGVMDPALPFPAVVDPEIEAERRSRAEEQLEEVAAELRGRGFTVATQVAVGLGVAATILEVQEREGAGLIAMSTHGQGGLRRAIIGSVADKVIRGAHCPVLAWRPPR